MLSRDSGRKELNNTIHKTFIHSVFTIITVTHVGAIDFARSTSQLALLELVLNCLNSVYGDTEALQEEQEETKKKKKGRKREIINKRRNKQHVSGLLQSRNLLKEIRVLRH